MKANFLLVNDTMFHYEERGKGMPLLFIHAGVADLRMWDGQVTSLAGYGTRLIQQAEAEARRRGCLVIVLTTHSFQAPDFYPKLGYNTVGVQEDWPAGYRQYTFSKRLSYTDS